MIEWQNNFEAVMTDRSALSDTYIKISPVPSVSEGRLVLEDNSTSNYEIIHYTSKDAGGVYTTDGGARNEDGNSNGIHAKGARVRMNLTAQDMQDIKDIATGSVVKDGSVTNAKLSTTAGDIGGAGKSWAIETTGFSSPPTVYGRCLSVGKLKYCVIAIYGISNTNRFTFTLPFKAATQQKIIVRIRDNNVNLAAPGYIELLGNSNIATCFKTLDDLSGATWTASSFKGIVDGATFIYESL